MERDEYEFELKLELIGDMIKTARKKRKQTPRTIRRIGWSLKKRKFQDLRIVQGM